MLNIDTSKSYATENNLIVALTKLGIVNDRPLIVRNREGRYTAVFGFHLSGAYETGDCTRYARLGFMTID
jgi:hypothetical protein